MERNELEIIKELMEELQDQMQYSEDDLSERLGRKKPEVEVLKVESKEPDEEVLIEDSKDMDEMSIPEDESPEESLKKRLMKLRG